MEESNPVIAPVKIPHVLQVSNELIKKGFPSMSA